MMIVKKPKQQAKKPSANIFSLLKPYVWLIIGLIFLAFLSNGLNLLLPQIISRAVDAFGKGKFVLTTVIFEFASAALFIFIFSYLQGIVQTFASERVARNLRRDLSEKISRQSTIFIQKITAGKLLTNLTSDVDSVKSFVSQATVSIISSVFLIIGASTLLLMTNWRLALVVLAIIPIIGFSFYLIFSRVRVLFRKRQEVIDWLNKIINEAILGSALIRVLNSQLPEANKFLAANENAQGIGMQVLRLFAVLIPIITFIANLATLSILALGGHFVISGSMTLGNFIAFNSYLAILIFPIIMIGFMSNVIAQATASYGRISEILSAEERAETGKLKDKLRGDISFKNVSLSFGEKPALKNVSLEIKGGKKTAIIGPTAAGKTQLLYLLTALTQPDSGTIEYDGKNINDYDKESISAQIGFVFQDSIIFNLTLKENIAFSSTVTDQSIQKAIATAEIQDFIESLPNKLETVVSERGGNLSGGQKQRIMLTRALALNPKILLLDDFTARVDTDTEEKILKNINKNYPEITLISITQKISAIENYDQIIVLMEGEVIASGTHKDLMDSCPEYVQIYNSQQSTNRYE